MLLSLLTALLRPDWLHIGANVNTPFYVWWFNGGQKDAKHNRTEKKSLLVLQTEKWCQTQQMQTKKAHANWGKERLYIAANTSEVAPSLQGALLVDQFTLSVSNNSDEVQLCLPMGLLFVYFHHFQSSRYSLFGAVLLRAPPAGLEHFSCSY